MEGERGVKEAVLARDLLLSRILGDGGSAFLRVFSEAGDLFFSLQRSDMLYSKKQH